MAKPNRTIWLKIAVIIFVVILWFGPSLSASAEPTTTKPRPESITSNIGRSEPSSPVSIPDRNSANAASLNCPRDYQINWPQGSPIWSFCWLPPDKSKGVDGSGLEIYNVFYKGKKVLKRANLPVLNVKYDPGGCGDELTLSYRDWQNELAPFRANNVVRSGYAEPTTPPKTACDTPGRDVGGFEGVTLERNSNRLLLTTQMQAGWYRYIQRWIFSADGTIRPQLGFSAVPHSCTNKPHTHHAYWRFDFDIEGPENDGTDEFNSGTWTALRVETNRLKSPETERKWRVVDRITNRGYEVIPPLEETASEDDFGIADVWALKYQDSERRDDGGARNADDRAQMNRYINGESLDNQNNVLWYHINYRHANGVTCKFLGPELKLIGSW